MTSDLELDLLGFPIALYARSYRISLSISPQVLGEGRGGIDCEKPTFGIFPPADLDEFLDVGDFLRHFGGAHGRGWIFVVVVARKIRGY